MTRHAVRRPGCRFLLGVILAGTACEQSQVLPAPRPTPVPDTGILAGLYALSIEFSPACSTVPELSAPRRYQVTLEPSTQVLGITIAGGGYAEPTAIGDLWPSLDGRVALLRWNTSEFPCDGSPEPLANGRALSICGQGGANINDRSVLADMEADVFIDAGGERLKVCGGTHRFTFTRAAL